MIFFIITMCVFVIFTTVSIVSITRILEKTNRILGDIRLCIIDVESELEKLNDK